MLPEGVRKNRRELARSVVEVLGPAKGEIDLIVYVGLGVLDKGVILRKNLKSVSAVAPRVC